jgi:hypothetical protein
MKNTSEEFLKNNDGLITTFTGKAFNVIHPNVNDIDIIDISHALSCLCRWNGHVQIPYSVAQHSMFVVNNLKTNLTYSDNRIFLAGLLHDASEAYLSDIARPLKLYFTQYKEIEDRLMNCIAEKFEFDYPLDSVVKRSDDYALQWEWKKFILTKDNWYLNWAFKLQYSKLIERKFLKMYYELIK